VKKRFIRSKLVFVAQAALVLAAVLLPNAPAFAHSPEIAPRAMAVSAPSPGMFGGHDLVPANIEQEQRLSAGPIIGLICAIVASSVALGIAFGIRRRIDRIAGPDPDKADDD
jgi:hypothetical protein